MAKTSSTGIVLWEGDMTWHLPLSALQLYTTPGINYVDPQLPTASDFLVRWALDWINHEGRKGGIAQTKEDWIKYLADPVPKYSTLAPYNIVIASSNNPISVAPAPGNISRIFPCAMARQGGRVSTGSPVLIERRGKKFTRGGPSGKISLP